MAENNISEAPDNLAMMSELDGLGQQIEALPTNALRAETEDKLKKLRASVRTSPNIHPDNLRAGIDDLRKDISVIQEMKKSEIQIQETLRELSPEKIESAIRSTETLIGVFPEGKYKTLLRGYAGSMILEQFEKNNHRIVLLDGSTIAVSVIDGSQESAKIGQNKIDLEIKLNQLLVAKKLDINTLRIGMLYRSPSFISYGNTSRDNMGNVLNETKARDSREYFKYLAEQKANGYKLTSSEDTIIASEKSFSGFDMLGAVAEAKDLGQMQKEVQRVLNSPNSPVSSTPPINPTLSTTPQSGNQIPSVVGEGVGMIGGAIGKIAGAGAKGGLGVVTDMFNSATKEGGAMGGLAVLGMLIASIWKFGFLKTIGGIFGIGVVSEAAAGRIDLGKEMGKVTKVAEKSAAALGAAAGSVGEMVDGATKPGEKKDKTEDDKKTSDTQKWFREGIMKDGALASRIETFSADQKKYKKEQTGKLDDYIKFIETDLQDVPLSKIFTTNHIESVFYDGPESGLPSKSELGKNMLKTVLRAYLMGSNYDTLTGAGDTMGKKEQDDFLKTYGISDADISTKKLSHILPIIQKKRLGGAPSVAPVVSTAPSTKIAIQGGEVALRDNVQVNSPTGIQAYDVDGKALASSVALQKDATGKYFVPHNKVVQIESTPITTAGIEIMQVSYAGEKFYLPKSVLTKI